MSDSIRLLLVEDNKNDAELLLRELNGAGFDLDSKRVETGPDLHRELSEGVWDIIISDFSMVGFDGLRAFKMARELRPEVPFIFVSGALGEERARQAKQVGALDHVLKTDLGRLPEVVRRGVSPLQEEHWAEATSPSPAETGPEAIDQFAHDFNNLLAIVVSYGRFAQRGVETDSTTYDDLEKVLEAAKGMEALTKKLRESAGSRKK